ncbi:hypothetical protein [Noviherbaspirillum sedimenti]|uniref:Helix-turn-helix domain-containing protein n=1 Tax=Noviherbaspirillum sedimenti TaxID=2320865 RepID=A0A3A3G1J1_9BURK|nr:hypothetical protein [Noviherbaspirillum sedimenti]RJG00342.1 hypothetical protein D3878_01085 [Noviherbaspirillum sedimenti]
MNMDTQKEYLPPLRPLYSLESAAKVAGVSAKLLASAIENGDIPGVRILHLGPRRLRYVYSRPVLAWLEGQEPPPDKGVEADRAAEAAVADNFDPVEYDDDLFN